MEDDRPIYFLEPRPAPPKKISMKKYRQKVDRILLKYRNEHILQVRTDV